MRKWINTRPYDQDKRVQVNIIDDECVVFQNGRIVIRATFICLKDVKFYPQTKTYSGLLSTFQELRSLAIEWGLGDDDTFEYTCVHFDDEQSQFLDECNIVMTECPYLDIGAEEKEQLIAIYPMGIQCQPSP